MKTTMGILLLMVMIKSATTYAEDTIFQNGDRIRVTNHLKLRYTGTLLNMTSDSLVLYTEQQKVRILKSRITRVEMSDGYYHNMANGAFFGLLIGGVGTGLISYAVEKQKGPCTETGMFACGLYDFSPEEAFRYGALIGGVLGAIVGAGVGKHIITEKWHDVTIDFGKIASLNNGISSSHLSAGIRIWF